MSYQLTAEKIIARPTEDVFQALKNGLLFMNCGAASTTMEIDFRVGGKYHIDFKGKQLVNFGEFLEIVPNKKIVFSWCQTFGPEQKPDTRVSIELFNDGSKTKLVLVHSGFISEESKENHRKGWEGGLVDLTGEVENGRLRLLRSYNVSSEKLFELCKNPETFFAFMGDLSKGTVDFRIGGKYHLPTAKGEIKGEFLEIVPTKKISLSWLVGCSGPLKGSQVTLNINPKEGGASQLELLHDGLHSLEDKKAHRAGWELVTAKMTETVSRAY